MVWFLTSSKKEKQDDTGSFAEVNKESIVAKSEKELEAQHEAKKNGPDGDSGPVEPIQVPPSPTPGSTAFHKRNFKRSAILLLLTSTGLAIIYGLKVNMSMVLVAMVNRETPIGLNDTSVIGMTEQLVTEHVFSGLEKCELPRKDYRVIQGTFDWSNRDQGLILGAYFYGYIVSQLPGGRLAERFGAKWVLFYAVAVNILGTLLTPIAARSSVTAVIWIRVLEGLAGGVTFPATHALLGKWAPPSERSFMNSMVYTGTCFGTVTSFLSSGIIAEKLGWEAVFYILGCVSIPWLPLWVIFAKNSPDQTMTVEEAERMLKLQKRSVPWKRIFTSRACWTVILTHSFSHWGWYLFLTQTPHFLTSVLGYSIFQSSILSSIPFLLMLIASISLSMVLDRQRGKNNITTTQARKIATSIATFGPASCMILIILFSCHKYLSAIFLSLGIIFTGAMYSGFLANHIDLTNNFAGSLMAVSNTFASFQGIFVTYHVGELTTRDPMSIDPWRWIFTETIICYLVGATVYLIFASGEEEDWNKMNDEAKPLKEDTSTYDSLLVH